MAPLLSQDDLYHIENTIYLPMLLTILHKDRELIDAGEFKLKAPYQNLIDQAIKCVEEDWRNSRAYIKQRDMRVIKLNRDDFMTEYSFFHDGYEEKRKYMNLRLRNRTEELMGICLAKAIF